MTNETANARAEYFAAQAAELYFAAATARSARCYVDAAQLDARATRATRNATAFRRAAQAH